jgi:hypothetical protein
MKKHVLTGIAETRECFLDGERLDPSDSYKIRKHSLAGFAWGYSGSGPSQLALAVVLKLSGKPDGYMEFKFIHLTQLPMNNDFTYEFYY